MKKMTLRVIEKQIKEHEVHLAELKKIRSAKLPNKTVQCLGFYVNKSVGHAVPKHRDGCKKRTKIGSLIYVQTHYYHSPHGCMGGDYWSLSEGGFVCPSCGEYNRLVNREDVVELKQAFKKVADVHRQKVTVESRLIVGKKKYFPVIK